MEIERKFLIKKTPENLEQYPHYRMEQGYLNTKPVLRIRRKEDQFIFTYKSAGLMCREEIEVPLDEASYLHLREKCDGNLIDKTRYKIPEANNLTIELDVFHGCYDGLLLAEVEFPSEAEANAYTPPHWFTLEVTEQNTFHNSHLSESNPEGILAIAKELLSNL